MSDEERMKRRKQRNLAIAAALGTFIMIVYLVTILKIGGQIVNRPF